MVSFDERLPLPRIIQNPRMTKQGSHAATVLVFIRCQLAKVVLIRNLRIAILANKLRWYFHFILEYFRELLEDFGYIFFGRIMIMLIPQFQMHQNLSDCVPIFNDGQNSHLAIALRTKKRVYIIDLINQTCPALTELLSGKVTIDNL